MLSSRPSNFYLHNITDKEVLFERVTLLCQLFHSSFFFRHSIDPILHHSDGRLRSIFYILIMYARSFILFYH